MRHLGSFVLSIILAPAIYLLVGIGEIKFATNGARIDAGQGTDWAVVGIGAAAVIGGGALYALLTLTRLSPIGPFLAGLAYLVASVWSVVSLSSLTDLIGTSTLGISGAQEIPLSGVALFLAIPLLCTILSPRRWRKRDQVALPYGSVPAQAGGDAAPAYPTPLSGGPVSAAPVYPTAVPATPTSPAPTGSEPTSPAPVSTSPAPAGTALTNNPPNFATPPGSMPGSSSAPYPIYTSAPEQSTPATMPDSETTKLDEER